MPLEFTPSLLVLVSSLMVLARLVHARQARKNVLWWAKSVLLAAVSAWSIYTLSLDLQSIAFGAWAFFVLLPGFLAIFVGRMILKGRYQPAIMLMRVVQVLHPSEGARGRISQLQLMADAANGRTVEEPQAPTDSDDDTSVSEYLVRLSLLGRWEEIVTWTDTASPSRSLRSILASFRIRALGELGRYPELCAYYLSGIKVDLLSSYMVQMMVAGFLGDTSLVKQLTEGPLATLEHDRREYWRALALRFDDREKYLETLLKLAASESPVLSRTAQNRLSSDNVEGRPTGELVEKVLHDMRTLLTVRRVSAVKLKPLLTWFFVAVLLAVFLLQELMGGSKNPEVLWRLGAANGYAVLEGEWWRLITANFLHYGYLHLALNTLCLIAIGPIAENFAGRRRYGLLLLLLTCTGVSSVVGLSTWGVIPHQTLVGASSVIMGLIGFELATSMRIWRETGHKEAKSRFALWILVVALQTAMDFVVVQVSLLAHLSGVLWGVLFSMVLLRGKRQA